jgi:hypothetical protein
MAATEVTFTQSKSESKKAQAVKKIVGGVQAGEDAARVLRGVRKGRSEVSAGRRSSDVRARRSRSGQASRREGRQRTRAGRVRVGRLSDHAHQFNANEAASVASLSVLVIRTTCTLVGSRVMCWGLRRPVVPG